MLLELSQLIAHHARHGRDTAIAGVTVSALTRPATSMAASSGTVFALLAQGTRRVSLGNRVHEYRAGEFLVAAVDLPVTAASARASAAKPALGVGLMLRPAAIASLLLEAPAGETRRASTPPGAGVGTASPELIDAVVRLLRLLDHPSDLPVLAPMLEREILWRLMTGEQGETVRQLGLADSALSSLNRTADWIREHHAEPLRVEELALRSRMSVSAFHRSFSAATSMSPIQFQKLIRLQEARLRLIAEPDDVAGAGYAVGYDSPSQFSREYRRRFGLPPGRDAVQLRAAALPPATPALP